MSVQLNNLCFIATIATASLAAYGAPLPTGQAKIANEGMVAEIAIRIVDGDKSLVKKMIELASSGNAAAQTSLGSMYQLGHGVQKNKLTAISWYRKASDQGYAEAQRSLADMYWHDRGALKNQDDAARLYRLAAENGDPQAQIMLGSLYRTGSAGFRLDKAESYAWTMKAAEAGYVPAQATVSMMLMAGIGAPSDRIQALKWMYIARQGGDAEHVGLFSEYEGSSLRAETEQAKLLARSWVKN